jgi:hypothetical protein
MMKSLQAVAVVDADARVGVPENRVFAPKEMALGAPARWQFPARSVSAIELDAREL